jgi:hypothetical protein
MSRFYFQVIDRDTLNWHSHCFLEADKPVQEEKVMFKDKMIKLVQQTELQTIFMQLTEGNNKIVLWQSNEKGGSKNSIHVKLGPVNSCMEEMTFYPFRGEFDFYPHSPIYFLGYRRTTIFKASFNYYSKNKIIINLPTEVMLNNSRKEEREIFHLNKTTIHYTHNPNFNSGLERMYQHSRLLDMSSTGLSFKSPLINVLRFKRGERIWIRSPLKSNNYLVQGEIRHVTPVSDLTTREKYLRVGVAYPN